MSDQHPLPKHIIKIDKLKSLLAILDNSVKSDTYIFRNLFANQDGQEVDILKDGGNSCGVFVSWILLALELIRKPHATVFATEKDLIASGWFEIQDLRPGAVIIWEKLKGEDNLDFMHIGFCRSANEAISNDSRNTGLPKKHHITYGEKDGQPIRRIEKIYWHSDLN